MSRKKRKLKNKKPKRRVSVAGGFLIYFVLITLVWPVDGVVRFARKINRQKNGLFEGEAIIADGNFADTVKESKQIILEVNPAGGFNYLPDLPTADNPNPNAVKMPEGAVQITKNHSDIFSGRVLRIDQTHKYQGKLEAPMTTFEGKNDCYRVRRSDLEIQPSVVDAFNQMMSAYQKVTGRTDLMVYSTTEASDTEGSLYPEELPDRATGLCIDLCVFNEDETISMFVNFDEWLLTNAWNYGFVFSYPEGDKDLTGINPAPYHLRYVGKIHTAVMHEHNLTLPRYIEEMKKHTLSDPYYYHDGTTDYTIYYVKANNGATIVPVTVSENYHISGNNADGFIVYTEGILKE